LGISIYREANQYYRLHQLKPISHQAGVEPMRIQALAQSDPGSLWIGTSDGLYTYELQSGQTQKVSIPNTAPGVTTMLVADGKLWVGAHDRLSSIDLHTHHVIQQVILEQGIIFIRQDVHDYLWVGMWLDGLFQLDTNGKVLRHYLSNTDGLPGIAANNLVSALPDGNRLWIGYNAGLGFSGFEPATDTWKHFHPDDGNAVNNNLSNAGTVTVITKGYQDHLWIGTHGGGIFYVNPTTKTYAHLSQASGLNSNYINSILADQVGHYWIATADGMNVLDSSTHTIQSLDMNFAFRDNDFRQNGLNGLNGNLYFFFNDHVIEIDPRLYRARDEPLHMVISNFSIFENERQLPGANKAIVLSHNENFFSFGFSVIKTDPLQKIQYAYRIDGFDQDWINTDRPFANYTNVPHGHYTFQVKAMHTTGQWSEPLITLPLNIHPPFWKTWWFMVLVVLSVTAAVYGLYHYRIKQLKKMMAVRAKISRDLHDEVGSVLSSIHVYSSVAKKAMEKNTQVTKDALQVIHDNSRQVMENMSDIVWAINSADEGGLSLEKKIKNYGFELLTPQNIV
ncbi:MAG TPA: triple tyrosine motif-containing protein, partial [Saprospiraceae bacterium]|nr:triple tyrosine motif-containing protein [Saprospiraceae bacterium]